MLIVKLQEKHGNMTENIFFESSVLLQKNGQNQSSWHVPSCEIVRLFFIFYLSFLEPKKDRTNVIRNNCHLDFDPLSQWCSILSSMWASFSAVGSYIIPIVVSVCICQLM